MREALICRAGDGTSAIAWRSEPLDARIEVVIGASSADIRLWGPLELN